VVCLPVFFSPGSPGQLILGLVICFLTYGMYGVYQPYDDPGDDVLAQMAQLSIFFSLVASIVTNAYPNDPVMSALLPLFLAVSIALMVLSAARKLKCVRCDHRAIDVRRAVRGLLNR